MRTRTRRKLDRPSTKPAKPRYPRSEEQIRRVTIGNPIRHDAPIALREYDSAWPDLFLREERRIRKALGPRAVQVEHVGSTSVPGLVAKPILDILLVVANSAEESSYAPALSAAAYVLRIREPEWYQHRLLKRTDPSVNLHVFSAGSVEIERMLRFRDILRRDQKARERYARTKRELARRNWKYVQNYADAKSTVVEAILAGSNRSASSKALESI